MKLTFCGAAGEVTGSCYLLETAGGRILIDCGMFQGSKELTALNYKPFLFDPSGISHVVLTHAHIDHCGLLPKLARNGFRGRIVGTGATLDLAEIVLEDSAQVQKQETEQENRRRQMDGLEPRDPIYEIDDVRSAVARFEEHDYGRRIPLPAGMTCVFRDAGHILGSAITEITINENGRSETLVCSGDLGQWGVPIVCDPTMIESADWLLIESTYGDRLHEGMVDREEQLLGAAAATYKKGGRLLIPAFSVERTQELLYSMRRLIDRGVFPRQKIFLDSPLAIKATEIFLRHSECFDEEARKVFTGSVKIPGLEYTPTVQDSMRINDYTQPCVVIAGSGMCNAGRIRHHLKRGLSEPRNTVLFVGYQASGTLGRYILDGAKEVRMMGITVPVRADVKKIDGFSAHADADGLVRWVRGFKKRPSRTFIVHGEPDASGGLGRRLETEGMDCHLPVIGESVELS